MQTTIPETLGWKVGGNPGVPTGMPYRSGDAVNSFFGGGGLAAESSRAPGVDALHLFYRESVGDELRALAEPLAREIAGGAKRVSPLRPEQFMKVYVGLQRVISIAQRHAAAFSSPAQRDALQRIDGLTAMLARSETECVAIYPICSAIKSIADSLHPLSTSIVAARCELTAFMAEGRRVDRDIAAATPVPRPRGVGYQPPAPRHDRDYGHEPRHEYPRYQSAPLGGARPYERPYRGQRGQGGRGRAPTGLLPTYGRPVGAPY